jgi:hypothetical protein
MGSRIASHQHSFLPSIVKSGLWKLSTRLLYSCGTSMVAYSIPPVYIALVLVQDPDTALHMYARPAAWSRKRAWRMPGVSRLRRRKRCHRAGRRCGSLFLLLVLLPPCLHITFAADFVFELLKYKSLLAIFGRRLAGSILSTK